MPAWYNRPYSTLNTACTKIKPGSTNSETPGRNDQILLQHFATRSFEDFRVKQRRGAGDHERSVAFRDDAWFDQIQR